MSSDKDEFGFAKLNEQNYTTWAPNVKALLLRRGLWSYTNGSIARPTESTAPEAAIIWLEKSGQAVGNIHATLDDSQKELIAEEFGELDAARMWTKLRDVHLQKKPSSRFAAYEALLSASLLDGESLPAFGARVSGLYRKVKDLYPTDFDLEKLGSELTVMSIVRGLGLAFATTFLHLR